MRIVHVRKGFACNSSSTHSVVFFAKGTEPRYDMAPDSPEYFGWENFTLVSKELRREYAYGLATRPARNAARKRLGDDLANEAKVDALTLKLLQQLGWKEDRFPAEPDHQSVIDIPCTFHGNHVLRPMFERVLEVLTRDGTVILGGNDNGDAHPLRSRASAELLTRLSRDVVGPSIGRDDKTHFTVFHPQEGMKYRIEFDAQNEPHAVNGWPARALTPELVDVKVTDYCEMDCAYCYQGSTRKGRHADMRQVEALLKALSENRVFEIAFGGGEPTSHPDFVEILKLTRELGMVPNFTTRNVDFIVKHPELFKDPNRIVGAVAISIDSVDEMRTAAAKLWPNRPVAATDGCALEVHRGGLQWQVVHGACSTEQLQAIMDAPERLFAPVLLLGWKTTGRGHSAKRVECDWESVLMSGLDDGFTSNACKFDPTVVPVRNTEATVTRLYIDTEFQRQFGKRLLELGAVKETMGAPEGTFGMYVDAVNGVLGPSSYCEKRLMQKLEPFASREFIREAWDMMSVDGGAKWAQGGLL